MKSKSNVLIALNNILTRNSTRLTPLFRSDGTANVAGDSLEYFMKDMFCTHASEYQMDSEKDKIYNKYLSWTGDSKHFPDFIIKGGVGVEPKKITGEKKLGNVALNSSYPKAYITHSTQNIPDQASIQETWEKKPIVYAIGNSYSKSSKDENKLYSLWLVYGSVMVPDNKFYENIMTKVRNSLSHIPSNDKGTKELGRFKGIDPLKRSNLRVRAMHELEHPQKIFDKYIPKFKAPDHISFIYLVIPINEYNKIVVDMGDKWNSLEKQLLEFEDNHRLTRNLLHLPDPNNTNETIDVFLFSGYTE